MLDTVIGAVPVAMLDVNLAAVTPALALRFAVVTLFPTVNVLETLLKVRLGLPHARFNSLNIICVFAVLPTPPEPPLPLVLEVATAFGEFVYVNPVPFAPVVLA